MFFNSIFCCIRHIFHGRNFKVNIIDGGQEVEEVDILIILRWHWRGGLVVM